MSGINTIQDCMLQGADNPQCINLFEQHCTTGSNFARRWDTTPACRYIFNRVELPEETLDKLTMAAFPEGTIDTDPFDFKRVLKQACPKVPRACEYILGKMCSIYNPTTMVSRGVTDICGCYLPDEEYERERRLFGTTRECTNQCSAADVPIFDIHGNSKKCTSNVCIINDIAIRLSGSSDISLTQTCGHCIDGAVCRCQVSGVNIHAVNTSIPSIDIEQVCGRQQTKCLVTNPRDPLGPPMEVDCVPPVTSKKSQEISKHGAIILLALGGGVLLASILAIFRARRRYLNSTVVV